MSNLYLVRHGQAGTRSNYDSLSELGRRQARRLGEYFVSEGIRFAAAYTGGMARQQQTGAEVMAAYSGAGVPFPALTIERGWDEFDLDAVYRGLAPRLSSQDAQFQLEYETMLRDIEACRENAAAEVHRRWRPCDRKIVTAWISGEHPYEGETWNAFRERVAACRPVNGATARDADIVVFTSATPTAIWAGSALEILDDRVMHLAGVLHNASYTILRLRGVQLRLFMFNAVPHLPPELRTFR